MICLRLQNHPFVLARHYPGHRVHSSEKQRQPRDNKQHLRYMSTFLISLQNNESVFLRNGEGSQIFPQERLTKFVSQCTEVLPLPIAMDLRARKGIKVPTKNRNAVVKLPGNLVKYAHVGVSGCQENSAHCWVPCMLTFTMQMENMACFLLNNLAFDLPKTLVLGSIKYHCLGVWHQNSLFYQWSFVQP